MIKKFFFGVSLFFGTVGYSQAGVHVMQNDSVTFSSLTLTGAMLGVSTATFPLGIISTVTVTSATITNLNVGTFNVTTANLSFSTLTVTNLTLGSINNTFIGLGRNRILNGDMVFDQEKEGTATYLSAGGMAHYALDNWRYEATGVSSFSYLQTNEALPPNNQFVWAMRMRAVSSGTIQTADGVNMEYAQDPTFMRDWGWGSASAQPITLSWWVNCSSAGVYSIAFINGVNNRSYVSTYTITAANTWQYETITIPGETTGGIAVWPTSGSVFGLKTVWDLGSGGDVVTSSLNSWLTNISVWKAAGTNSLSNSLGNMYITGVQEELGTKATAFEFLPYAMELQALQRYYWKSFPPGTPVSTGQGGPGAISYISQVAGAVAYGVYVSFPTPMLTNNIVVTTYNPVTPNAKWYNVTRPADSAAATVSNAGASGMLVSNLGLAAESAGQLIEIHATANARLGGP